MVDVSKQEIKRQLQQIDPYDFEKLVAEVWELLGYQTTVRKGSGDRGVDIEATKLEPFQQKVLIQTKRYTGNNKIGSQEVRSYATLYQQISDADTVVIVTTGRVTSEAKALAKNLNVKLIDGDSFVDSVINHIDDINTVSIGSGESKTVTQSDSTSDLSSSSRSSHEYRINSESSADNSGNKREKPDKKDNIYSLLRNNMQQLKQRASRGAQEELVIEVSDVYPKPLEVSITYLEVYNQVVKLGVSCNDVVDLSNIDSNILRENANIDDFTQNYDSVEITILSGDIDVESEVIYELVHSLNPNIWKSSNL